MRKHLLPLLLLPTLLLPAMVMGQAPPVLELKTRIPLANVKGRMDHLSVDVKGSVFSQLPLTITPSKLLM